MTSCRLLQRKDPCFQSPAKIFAKLKSKVQKEAKGDQELIRKVGEQHGHGVKAAGITTAGGPGFNRDPEGLCWSEKMKNNNMFASCQTPAQAVTLSPISSPEETVDCLISRVPLHQVSPLKDRFCGFPRKNRVLMESTSVSQPPSGAFRDQSPEGFNRIQPAEICGKSAFSKEALSLNLKSPCCVFTPIKNRLRKRKLDLNDTQNPSRTTEDSGPPQARRPAVFGDSVDPCRPVWGNLKRFPEPRESRSNGLKRPAVILDTGPTMSPAKLFALMKESKKEHHQVETCSRRELFAGNQRNLQESSDTDVFSNHCMERMQDVPSVNTAVNQDRVESPESQSEALQDTPIPASLSPTVLLEDPLVLNTPQIFIPKKDAAVFRRNAWPKQKKFPYENVIHLKKWFLRRNRQGLFVDGINVEENIQWNSNVITERISSSVLKTVSGRVYILMGQMNIKLASDFPKKFLKKFVNGFPSNWKAIYEAFLSESKEQAEKNKEAAILSKNEPQLSSRRQPVRQQKVKSVKTHKSLPSASSLNVSRSGRVIKPPLEYWKGGRVVLDAQMNVTIHEGYEVTSPSTSKKPVPVLFPSIEGLKRHESSQDEGCSVPERRVKTDRKLHRAEANQDQNYTDSTNETISNQKAVSGRTRCNRQRPGAEKRPCSDAGLQKRREPERSSKKQTQNVSRPPTRTTRTVTNPHESRPVRHNASNPLSRDYELPSTRRRRADAGRGAKSLTSSDKSESDDEVSFSQSPEAPKEKKRSRAARKRSKVQEEKKKKKESRSSKAPPPATKPGRKRQPNKHTVVPYEKDGDEWTEDEILKLQEAVSCYPRHVAGYWAKVARMVGTRSAEECYKQHTCQGNAQSPKKSARKCRKVKEVAAKPAEIPVVSARVGTLKRIKQVRQFLDNLPREDVDDAFSSAYMQNKRMEIPSVCSSEDHDFAMSDLEPQTPPSSCFPEAKTPQCLHITPGMLGSPNTKNDDKYVFQLQKRMKKNQFNVHKTSSSKTRFSPTPSAKRTLQRCVNTGNDTFFVFEMFPGDDGEISESEEEEDFYFSHN